MKATGQSRIPSLDGLRAVSILLVLLGHGGRTIPLVSLLPERIFYVLANSSLGVFIFFVISGFLITSLLVAEQSKSGTISIKHFYIRRAFRIWPAFYVSIAIIAILGIMHAIPLRIGEAVAAALYVWNYYPNGQTYYLSHTWSLSIEEQFYFFWPLALKLSGKARGTLIAIGVVALSPLIRVANYFLWPSSRGHIPIMLHTRADALMFGAAVALLYDNAAFQRFLTECFKRSAHIVAALFVFFVSPLLAFQWGGKYLLPIGWTLDGIAVVLILTWAVREHPGPFGKLLNSRVALHLGALSYSLYLWHVVFMGHGTWIVNRFPLNFLCAFAAAELSYRFVEKPFLAMRARLSESWSARSQQHETRREAKIAT